jgi:restriction system protein
MTVPGYQDFMLPLLKLVADGQTYHIQTAADLVANDLGLSEEDRLERVPSQKQYTYLNRVHWAKTYLKSAGLLESVGRGLFRITPRGIAVLQQKPEKVNVAFLTQFEEFREFKRRSSRNDDSESSMTHASGGDAMLDRTPDEIINTVLKEHRQNLADELLDYILNSSPAFFEDLVVDLLRNMGYGGTTGIGRRLGRTDDGGVDGVIQEDKLGLDNIYIQAKRWQRDTSVGRPVVQAFVGSLMGIGATKGVLITTGRFAQTAMDYTRTVGNLKVVLVDGDQLAQLMIDHNVGVSVERSFDLKKVDKDYFEAL